MTSPTQRSLKMMRDAGWTCEIVEHYNSFTRKRNDLLGFADLLCLKVGSTPLLLQVTSSGGMARVNKILNDCTDNARLALMCGFDIEVHAWRKLLKKRGGKAKYWSPKVYVVSLRDGEPYLVDDKKDPTD